MMKFEAARSATFLAAIILAASACAASATTVTLEVTNYSLSYQALVGNGPTLTHDLKVSSPISLTVGTESSAMNFFTASPAGSCGNGCAKTNPTASGTITASIWLEEVSIVGKTTTVLATGSLTETALYSADYKGQLACSQSTGSQTDCVDWSDNTSFSKTNPTKITVNMSNGSVLDVWLINAWDWSIIPQIQFEDPVQSIGHSGSGSTPLPPALALFGSGLALMSCFGRPRAKSATPVVFCHDVSGR